MPRFEPFKATTYSPDLGNDISNFVAPPYDVIDAADRAALLSCDPLNSVRLILPETYASAAKTWTAWRSEGHLVDQEVGLWAYTMARAAGKSIVGVIGQLALSDEIIAHEQTVSKTKTDRLELLRATHANFDPVWGLSTSSGLGETIGEPPPDARVAEVEKVTHVSWKLEAGVAQTVCQLISENQLVLADGHHRFETGRKFFQENPRIAGAGSIMCFVVGIDAEVPIEPIHRVFNNDVDWFGASEYFSISPASGRDVNRLQLYTLRGFANIDPTPSAFETISENWPASVANTDAAFFETCLRSSCEDGLEFLAGDERCVDLVDSGTKSAALLLRPPALSDVRAAASEMARFPQKTTFFSPKPRTGFVFRDLNQ